MEIQLQNLKTEHFGRKCIYLDSVDSTNTYLKQNGNLPYGTVVMTNNQYAGRGRRGNVWLQKSDGSVALSVLIHSAEISDMGILPLLCGIAAAQSVNGTVKWPNDIVIDGKKVCGILCESLICGKNVSAICGFGVNLTQSKEDFESSGLPHASSVLVQTGEKISSEDICSRVMNSLEALWNEYKDGGIDDILKRYSDVCITLGREVRVIVDSKETVCTAVSINRDGSLHCKDEDGSEFDVRAGEASVRGLYGYI